MPDNETRNQNRQAHRSSCPYPLTTHNFPVPLTSTNPPSAPESQIDCSRLGLSHYIRDHHIMPGEFPSWNTQSPSAPFIDGFSDDQSTRTHSGSGFLNPMNHQPQATSSDPPPSYNELYAPEVVVVPKTPPHESPSAASVVRSPGAIFSPGHNASPAPITGVVHNSRIITHPIATLTGVRSNYRDRGSAACVTATLAGLIGGIIFLFVLMQIKWH